MGLMRADKPLLTDSCAGESESALPTGGEYEFSQARREPSGRPRAADPYAVWLAQREAERERDESARIRWVYRHPRVTRPAAGVPPALIDVTLDERDASDGEGGFAVLA
jgi:hypothetical protein